MGMHYTHVVGKKTYYLEGGVVKDGLPDGFDPLALQYRLVSVDDKTVLCVPAEMSIQDAINAFKQTA